MNGEFHAQAVRLETPRLILRPWSQADLRDLNAYASVDGVGQMAGWLPHRSLEESREILNLFMQEDKTLCLEHRETGRAIGSIGLEEVRYLDAGFDPLRGREIGYVLSKSYWGQGLMPEAVRAVMDYCFQVLRYDFLTCGYFIRNQQSRRVNEKLGFVFYKQVSYETRCHTVEAANLNLRWNPEKERMYV